MRDAMIWSGLTDGQVRTLARELVMAIAKADRPEALPGDDWLDVRLRDLGCPEGELETWRDRVRSTPLRSISDQAV
jgi:hypothetical protein